MSSFWNDIKQDTCQNLSSLVQPLLSHADTHDSEKSPKTNGPEPKPHKTGKRKTTLKRNNENKKQPPKNKKTKKKLTIDNFM